ncbi:response regulator, partial [bacterium]|nr:response regulator [bacterium]
TFTSVPDILVVDDSLTTRTLMRELLENAGYQVTVAVDGLQAWEFLQKDNYDLLVSDVDMPGITGFDLTFKIRSSRELKTLPVILVTGKEKQEDKRRGLNLGASAYILKSKFDEGVLLETVESLIGKAVPGV